MPGEEWTPVLHKETGDTYWWNEHTGQTPVQEKLVTFGELLQGTLHSSSAFHNVCTFMQVRQLHSGIPSQAHKCQLLWDQEVEVQCNSWEGW